MHRGPGGQCREPILSLLALGLKHGTEVEVCAEGGDEAAAVRAVTDFIAGIRE